MTPEQAETLQVEMWRRLSLQERLRIVFAMIEDGFALVAASIRTTYPRVHTQGNNGTGPSLDSALGPPILLGPCVGQYLQALERRRIHEQAGQWQTS
jgi:hypothetical protein